MVSSFWAGYIEQASSVSGILVDSKLENELVVRIIEKNIVEVPRAESPVQNIAGKRWEVDVKGPGN